MKLRTTKKINKYCIKNKRNKRKRKGKEWSALAFGFSFSTLFALLFAICVNKRLISLTSLLSFACLRALETHLSCLYKRVCFVLQVSSVVLVPSSVVEFQTAKFVTLFSLLGLLFSLVITYFLLMYCNWRRSTVYIKSLECKVKNACLTTPNHSIKEIMLLNWVAKSLGLSKNIIRRCIFKIH